MSDAIFSTTTPSGATAHTNPSPSVGNVQPRFSAFARVNIIETLSGGNQQKVVMGKWLLTDADVLIVDEPTRGVDVGAKSEIHRRIRALADTGKAVLVISSELPEVLALADRILVMCEGRITGELDGARATAEQVLNLALPAGRAA